MNRFLLSLLVLPALLLAPAPAAHAAEPEDGTLPPMSVGQPTIDRLIRQCDSLYTIGFSFAARGMNRIADWYVGQSVAAISSLRGAITDLYMSKKGVREDEEFVSDNELLKSELGIDLSGLMDFANALQGVAHKMGDVVETLMPGAEIGRDKTLWWPMRESISLVSPYGPLFHGLVLEYKGNKEEAAKYYAIAMLNPYLDPGIIDFGFLADMEMEDLFALSRKLSSRENDYRNIFSGNDFYFELPAYLPWSAEYHRAMAIAWLEGENPNYYTAFHYLEAALHADPFDIVNYENLARMCVATGNYRDLATYVTEGLSIDPDNAFFNGMAEVYKKHHK